MHETPSLTHLFKELREEKHERVIEDLLFDYPYLIDNELSNPQRQIRLNAESRGDLLFFLPKRVVVAEIKRGPVNVAAFKQICRYLELLRKDHPHRIHGYLIGTLITPAARTMIKRTHWKIKFRALGYDIPNDVVICRKCRRARDEKLPRCPADRSRELL
jgi:RecB family endonuclease NucS